MMKRNICNLVVLCCISLLACSKSDNKKPADNVSLITSTKWVYSSAGLDVDNNGTKDTDPPPGVLQSCDTDNTITFKSDNTGVMDEGATKCETSDPQTVAFNWSFK